MVGEIGNHGLKGEGVQKKSVVADHGDGSGAGGGMREVTKGLFEIKGEGSGVIVEDVRPIEMETDGDVVLEYSGGRGESRC